MYSTKTMLRVTSTYLLDSADFGGLFLRDFAVELFFDGHDKLNGVQRVGTEVIDESGGRGDLVGIDTKLGDNDVLDLVFNTEKGGVGTSTGEAGRGESGGASDEGGNNNLAEHLDLVY